MSPHWHLAIEASSVGGSVALLKTENTEQEQLFLQETLPHAGGSVRSLAPTISRLLQTADLQPAALNLISVTNGPGSFTGLRVGLATAKMLAWAHKIPIAPVDTLEAIALRFAQANLLPSGTARCVAAINAFRKQVFTSTWIISAESKSLVACEQPSTVCDADKWLEQSAGPLWVTGSALDFYSNFKSADVMLAPSSIWQPTAEQVGQLGSQLYRAGNCVSAAELLPNYIRSSAAEEKL